MGKLNMNNLRKTLYYLKKNGLKDTMYAVTERMQNSNMDSYTYTAPTEGMLKTQRERNWKNPVTFSILVPLYHTPKAYFKEMVESVLQQTYPYFQLILLDAGAEASEKAVAEENTKAKGNSKMLPDLSKLAAEYGDDRICYYKLAENLGIAENTNAGLEYATGDYIALLDHDDILTVDALYEFAKAIEDGKKRGVELQLLYSDEDKCDGDGKSFYEPHYKLDFNFDLLLTNNYICHFTALKAELFKELKLRGEYNGAQDFDLVLRVAGRFRKTPQQIFHIPKILYHWRCHRDSTAANPASKSYAYEAGKQAVEAFAAEQGWDVDVTHSKHQGFYRVWYNQGIFKARPEVGAEGGYLYDKAGKIYAGMMDARGTVAFGGMISGFSGYMNRAHMVHEAEALDLRYIHINPDCEELLIQMLGEHNLYRDKYNKLQVKPEFLESDEQAVALSLKFSKALKDAGYVLVWDPYLSNINPNR